MENLNKMALKDWKKKEGLVWVNEINNSEITIGKLPTRFKGLRQGWEVSVINEDTSRFGERLETSKNKSEAIAFARQYMREH